MKIKRTRLATAMVLAASFTLGACGGEKNTTEFASQSVDCADRPTLPSCASDLAERPTASDLPSQSTTPSESDSSNQSTNQANERVCYENVGVKEGGTYGPYRGSASIDLSECDIIAGYVEIEATQIQNIVGLEHIKEIRGSLSIERNTNLVNLQGLESLKKITGNVTIESNNFMFDLTGMDNLTSVEGYMIIRNNHDLYNLKGLGSLKTVGAKLELDRLPIGSMDELESLTSVGELYINGLNEITDLSGLEGLTRVEGNVVIGGRNLRMNLDSLNGLNNLESIGGNLTITGYTNLDSLRGIETLNRVEGDFQLITDLDTLSGLEQLTRIDGNVTVGGDLKSFVGLNNLATVGRALSISGRFVEDLQGFSGLRTVGGDLKASRLMKITDLFGLYGVVSVGRKLQVKDNPKLAGCEVDLLAAKIGLENIASGVENTRNYGKEGC